eukprot:2201407-Rhodomonas_salina.6
MRAAVVCEQAKWAARLHPSCATSQRTTSEPTTPETIPSCRYDVDLTPWQCRSVYARARIDTVQVNAGDTRPLAVVL